jgi:hypothetical protein
MCIGSEAGSYPRLIDFAYLSTLGLKVIKKKKRTEKWEGFRGWSHTVDHGTFIIRQLASRNQFQALCGGNSATLPP